MDNVITIDNSMTIAGLKSGDEAIIVFHNGSRDYVILSTITHDGIEAFDRSRLNQPLSFYPWVAIKKVTADTTDIEDINF